MSVPPVGNSPLEIPFDFRKPPAGPAQERVKDWLTSACRAAPKFWAAPFACTPELLLVSVEPSLPGEALRTAPETAIGFVLESSGNPLGPRYLILSRPTLLTLLAATFGEPPVNLAADRDLTPIEAKLLNYLLEIVLEPIRTPLTGTEPLPLKIAAFGPARTICPLPANESATLASLYLVLPCGPQTVSLFCSPAPLATDKPADATTARFDRAEVETALADASLDFDVVLGRTQLTFRQLTALEVGDVVVLEQPVAEPLRAEVGGTGKFEVWPGVLGRMQAVQICRTLSAKTP